MTVAVVKTSLALIVGCLAFVAVTFAATPPAPPANRVVVALKDGSTLSGELVEATPAGVTIRQSAKTPPVTKPWSAIKQLGNGMTHESILAEWRATKADQLCETCTGEGDAKCEACDGKGVDPATAKACEKCEGTGSTGKCKTPRCDAGKIPCPNTCLKPSDFQGPPRKDGKRWKSFRAKGGGSQEWSDGHIGQLIVYVDGMPENKGVCPRCAGKSVIDDVACRGTGKQTCVTCHGHGVTGEDCKLCVDGQSPCKTCGATGLKAATTQVVTQ